MSKLKPCPFCGGEVIITDEEDFYMISCERCGCGVTFSSLDGEDEIMEASKEETITSWNSRAMENVVTFNQTGKNSCQIGYVEKIEL